MRMRTLMVVLSQMNCVNFTLARFVVCDVKLLRRAIKSHPATNESSQEEKKKEQGERERGAKSLSKSPLAPNSLRLSLSPLTYSLTSNCDINFNFLINLLI